MILMRAKRCSTQLSRSPIASAVLAVLLTACAKDRRDDISAPTGGNDAGSDAPDAAARSDGAAAFDASFQDGGALSPSEDAEQGCSDLVDGDFDGLVDCEDLECGGEPLCCVGSSAAQCCTDVPPVSISFATCSSDLTSCGQTWGLPLPGLEAGAWVAHGDVGRDSGFAAPGVVTPSSARVSLTARLRQARTSCQSCIDFLGMGLVSADALLESTTRVRPDVALIINNADQEVRLVSGERVLASISYLELQARGANGIETSTAIERTWTLTAAPDGSVSVQVGGIDLWSDAPLRTSVSPRARVVLYGQSTHRDQSSPPAAAAFDLQVRSSLCEAPALATNERAVLPDAIDSWWAGDEEPRASSLLSWSEGGQPRGEMIYEFRGSFHRASMTTEGDFRAPVSPYDPRSVVLSPAAAGAAAISDPELVRGESAYVLYYTAVDTEGTMRVARSRGASDFGWSFGVSQTVLSPDDFLGIVGFSEPTVLELSGQLLLAVVRTHEGGSRDIVLYRLEEDRPVPLAVELFETADHTVDSEYIVARSSNDSGAFDRDDVGGPSLVHHRGVTRLYYAGLRGTRWSIGLLLSEDLRHWHHYGGTLTEGAPVLGGDGQGFDSVWVRAPDAAVDLARQQILLSYTGYDGARETIGVARLSAPLE